MGTVLLGWLALVGACHRPVVVGRPLQSAVVEYEQESLDPKTVKALLEPDAKSMTPADHAADFKDGEAYRVGPGDSLLVAVYGHPELAIASYAGINTGVALTRTSGFLVDNDGSIQFPLMGTVQVAGKTTAELRTYLETELARYVKDPKVTVQVAFNGSIRYYMLGQFTIPGVKFSDRPLRVLQAVSLAGSINLERASLRMAYVARGERRLPINFRRLIREGDLSQNVKLSSGDIVMVPDNLSEQAFVFGAVAGGATRGGAVSFLGGRLNILQALSAAGFGFRERFQARLSRVRVIRSDGDKGEFFTVDVSRILTGEAAPFQLLPGDVVYVPATPYMNWNLVLEQLLPTLQTVAGALQPFVQIKYLRDSDNN